MLFPFAFFPFLTTKTSHSNFVASLTNSPAAREMHPDLVVHLSFELDHFGILTRPRPVFLSATPITRLVGSTLTGAPDDSNLSRER